MNEEQFMKPFSVKYPSSKTDNTCSHLILWKKTWTLQWEKYYTFGVFNSLKEVIWYEYKLQKISEGIVIPLSLSFKLTFDSLLGKVPKLAAGKTEA